MESLSDASFRIGKCVCGSKVESDGSPFPTVGYDCCDGGDGQDNSDRNYVSDFYEGLDGPFDQVTGFMARRLYILCRPTA